MSVELTAICDIFTAPSKGPTSILRDEHATIKSVFRSANPDQGLTSPGEVSQTVTMHSGRDAFEVYVGLGSCDRNPYVKDARTPGRCQTTDTKYAWIEMLNNRTISYGHPGKPRQTPIGAELVTLVQAQMALKENMTIPQLNVVRMVPGSLAIPTNCCETLPPTFNLKAVYRGRAPNVAYVSTDAGADRLPALAIVNGRFGDETYVTLTFPSSIIQRKSIWLYVDLAYEAGPGSPGNSGPIRKQLLALFTDSRPFADESVPEMGLRTVRTESPPATALPGKVPVPIAPQQAAHPPTGPVAQPEPGKQSIAPKVSGTPPQSDPAQGGKVLHAPPSAPVKAPPSPQAPIMKEVRKPVAPNGSAPALPQMGGQ